MPDTSLVEPAFDESLDAIGGGRVRLLQPRRGYRFNLDAVLLAGFAAKAVAADRPVDVVDLGTGCGVVALLVAAWRPNARVQAVEVQPAMAALARRNAQLNGLPVEVVEADWRAVPDTLRADLVVSNPPYFPPARGRPPVDEGRAAARFESHGDVSSLANSAARRLKPGGAVRLVHAASRTADVLDAFRAVRLLPTVMRFVHPRASEAANTVLIELRRDSRRPLVVEPPLVVHASAGREYSPEVAALLSARPDEVLR